MAPRRSDIARASALRGGAVALSLLAVALVAEIALRLAGYAPLEGAAGGGPGLVRLSGDRDRQYELVPGAQREGRRSRVAINEHGFRDAPRTLAKPPGTHRIVMLGDSITFAGAHQLEERFTERLQDLLTAGDVAVEVLNLGVGGYDVLNEVATYEQVGSAFDPDQIVLAYCINDVGIHSLNLRTLRFLERYGSWTRTFRLAQLLVAQTESLDTADQFERLNNDRVFRETFSDRILEVSDDADLARLHARLERLLAQRAENPPPFATWYASMPKLGRLRYAFERLARAAGDVPVLVAIIPYLDEGDAADTYRAIYDLVEHEARRAGLEVLQLRDAFSTRGFDRLGGHNPIHPNAEGHEVIAEELAEALSTADGR